MSLLPRHYKIQMLAPPDGADSDGWEKIPTPRNATAKQKRFPFYRTTRDWGFVVEMPGTQTFALLVVREGTRFNGSSSGTLLGRAIIGQLNTMEAAGIHDGFYTKDDDEAGPAAFLIYIGPITARMLKEGDLQYSQVAGSRHQIAEARIVARRTADDLFFAALRDVNGIPRWRRLAGWLAVRTCGRSRYKTDQFEGGKTPGFEGAKQ